MTKEKKELSPSPNKLKPPSSQALFLKSISEKEKPNQIPNKKTFPPLQFTKPSSVSTASSTSTSISSSKAEIEPLKRKPEISKVIGNLLSYSNF
jgi:hypothetical protein